MPKPASKPTAKPIIAIDIDDVLAANAKGFVEFSNKRWHTNLTVEDYHDHWAQLWQVDNQESARRHQELFDQKVVQSYEPLLDAGPVLNKLTKNYELIAVTARWKSISAETKDWLDQYFPGAINDISHMGVWDDFKLHSKHKLGHTKTDLCLEIDAKYLIDDQPKHCIAAANAGIKSILFGDYAWNRSVKLPKGVIRAKTWTAVLEYFNAQSR